MTRDEGCCTSTTSSTANVRYPDLPRESIEQAVHSAHEHFANRKVRDFVPLLVERLAREKLQALVPT
ncbi:three-helix bundle dimerization domain-containing protein [Rhodococcus opacus]|uniref:three-helix bundle dimerization domain-containing protein n=1 Tax=Rhodococcus opacus TaxID=37919 RepID=UPI0002A22967|nr:hypothetical protein [Rhodococcus opacus]ELB88887.1 hypothetical protein Rwratislav_32485 [Rhodococcus wratislaviensis IFP 2016]MDX5967834.1 hypothetical protein [Rhodococcus opacus]NKY75936.1 hypothetical protein [Rhodococcus opacus]QZS59258.1 hypothetical protein FXW36_20765 [Rhodococcus opacus]RKM74156.1 hypothetical protein COO55_20320 [Rhodococcus opacus]